MSSCFMSVPFVSIATEATQSSPDGSAHSPGGSYIHNGFASRMRNKEFGKSSSSTASLPFVPKWIITSFFHIAHCKHNPENGLGRVVKALHSWKLHQEWIGTLKAHGGLLFQQLLPNFCWRPWSSGPNHEVMLNFRCRKEIRIFWSLCL